MAQSSNEEQITIDSRKKQLSYYTILTKLVLALVLVLDKLRMLLWHNISLQDTKRTRKGNLAGQTNVAEASSHLWTLTTALYALSGGLTIKPQDSGLAHLTLSPKMIYRLCAQDPKCLRQIREPEIVDRSKNTRQRFMTYDLIPCEDPDASSPPQPFLDKDWKAHTFNTWGLSLISRRSFEQMHHKSTKVYIGQNIPSTGFSVQSDSPTADQKGYILPDDLRQYAEATFDTRIGLLLQKRRQNINLIAFRPQDLLYSLATFTAYGAVHLGAWNYKFTTAEEGRV
ncbi:hypothetical protein D0869_13909 [Hortaea werneckii]|uniref:Uncharacterized protein n=1 Tax=Hortaea werneckii TaxID=91943 RepID=A0A3M6XL45_HORWE|nr:hypothetical protein KC324_g9543 [Hortaea werneckii]KAI7579164.1 hypothetical protein KC316_g9541 [Hortaea werneckii]KAI7665863.1 hypothetical protein KC318_g6846 [Hortaea werneckii]RMX73137.1 hypothetical protein D0869_13909 [Hortaea werneckii]RMX91553.1 hypothetical protein D0868_13921 [Hortaea werneckii]